jgi:hypothetical protein
VHEVRIPEAFQHDYNRPIGAFLDSCLQREPVEKFGEKVDKSVLLALLPCQRESVGRKKKEDAQLPAERVCFRIEVVY